MTYTIEDLRKAFPEIDGIKLILIKRIINKEIESNELELFDSNAKWIMQCYNRPNDTELSMNALNELIEGFGTEAIKNENAYVNKYYSDCIGIYVNMGDSYAMTIIYDTNENEFLITSWGDFIEAYEQSIENESNELED